jgi:hypothetical protein
MGMYDYTRGIIPDISANTVLMRDTINKRPEPDALDGSLDGDYDIYGGHIFI